MRGSVRREEGASDYWLEDEPEELLDELLNMLEEPVLIENPLLEDEEDVEEVDIARPLL